MAQLDSLVYWDVLEHNPDQDAFFIHDVNLSNYSACSQHIIVNYKPNVKVIIGEVDYTIMNDTQEVLHAVDVHVQEIKQTCKQKSTFSVHLR